MGVGLFVGEFWHNPETNWQHELTLANQFIRSKFNN
jgi:hypothetical protein